MKTLRNAAIAAALVAVSQPASAFDFSIGSFDNGYYTNDGFHSPPSTSTLTGFVGFGDGTFRSFRSFFAFSVPNLPLPIASAQVEFRENGFSFGPFGSWSTTLTFWSFDGDSGALLDGTGGVRAFNDLGSGRQLGSTTVTRLGSGTPTPQFAVDFNSVANGLIEASAGGTFVFGADMEFVGTGSQIIWEGSGGINAATLNLTLVPEIDAGGFAAIAFILGSLGLWLYSTPPTQRRRETV